MRIGFLTHEPFHPPSGGGSAEAQYLVRELAGRGHDVHVFCPQIEHSNTVGKRFGVTLHEFSLWTMGRYARLRNFKYLAYPYFLQRLVLKTNASLTSMTGNGLDLLLSQHTISAVAAGKLRSRMNIPVVMNFLDYLTGFMEAWPAWAMLTRRSTPPRRYAWRGVTET